MERKLFAQGKTFGSSNDTVINFSGEKTSLCQYGHHLTRYRYQRERLLSDVGFHCIPFCEDTVELMKETFIWRNLIKEILQHKGYTLRQVANECNTTPELLKNFIQQNRSVQKMPDLTGTKILEIHTKVCPEYNPPGLQFDKLNS